MERKRCCNCHSGLLLASGDSRAAGRPAPPAAHIRGLRRPGGEPLLSPSTSIAPCGPRRDLGPGPVRVEADRSVGRPACDHDLLSRSASCSSSERRHWCASSWRRLSVASTRPPRATAPSPLVRGPRTADRPAPLAVLVRPELVSDRVMASRGGRVPGHVSSGVLSSPSRGSRCRGGGCSGYSRLVAYAASSSWELRPACMRGVLYALS